MNGTRPARTSSSTDGLTARSSSEPHSSCTVASSRRRPSSASSGRSARSSRSRRIPKTRASFSSVVRRRASVGWAVSTSSTAVPASVAASSGASTPPLEQALDRVAHRARPRRRRLAQLASVDAAHALVVLGEVEQLEPAGERADEDLRLGRRSARRRARPARPAPRRRRRARRGRARRCGRAARAPRRRRPSARPPRGRSTAAPGPRRRFGPRTGTLTASGPVTPRPAVQTAPDRRSVVVPPRTSARCWSAPIVTGTTIRPSGASWALSASGTPVRAAAATLIASNGARSGRPAEPSPTTISTASKPAASRLRAAACASSAWRSIVHTVAAEAGEQRGVPARAGPDVEHAIARAHVEQLEHVGDDERLGDRLVGADRQRPVLPCVAGAGRAGRRAPRSIVGDRLEHPGVADLVRERCEQAFPLPMARA